VNVTPTMEVHMQALELRRSGLPLPVIADRLGYANGDEAAAGIHDALDSLGVVTDPALVQRMALDRLDRMLQGVWLKAVKGDPAAVDRVMRIEAERVRLAGAAPSTVMTSAFDKTVESLHVTAADESLVASGRRLAEKIDMAAGSADPMAETKALYLVPHLRSVLRELGATPAARAAVKNAKETSGGKLADLRAARRQQGQGPAAEKRPA
jgi:hypothetical protein